MQLWGFGVQFAAEVVLEGLARSGGKGRCTVMGRSAMSLDLQGLQQGLQGIVGGSAAVDSLASALRIVDAYIKAFYIPWGEELHRWALTHPEYTRVCEGSKFTLDVKVPRRVQTFSRPCGGFVKLGRPSTIRERKEESD